MREDLRCGKNYTLPDGSPAQCDARWKNRCCNHQTGLCSISSSITGANFTANHFRKESEVCADESYKEKEKRWRLDRKCGSGYPLPDGAPAECDPDSVYPCCSEETCRSAWPSCGCRNCVDYRVVRDIRSSGERCANVKIGGFLKHACFDEKTHQLNYKCPYSEVYYESEFADPFFSVSALCDNDPRAYQACGFYKTLNNSDVLCGGYFCDQREDGKHKYINCSGMDCQLEHRNCVESVNSTDTSNTICSDDCENIGVINGSIPFCNKTKSFETDCFFNGSDCVKVDKFGECDDDSQLYFRCPRSSTYIRSEKLCDGIESCGENVENMLCNEARDYTTLNKSTRYNSQAGLHEACTASGQNITCELKEFRKPWGYAFGEPVIEVYLPTSKIKCGEKFGEHYVFLSCMGLCEEPEATCPFKNAYNQGLQSLTATSCPGKYLDRVFTINNESSLTFLVKSKSSGKYEQNIFRCKNQRCIDFAQVCDLNDDCGDFSDEEGCVNRMNCNDAKGFFATKQKCDGVFDCFDLSDECNESCGREILGKWMVKITCCFMGILAVAFNCVSVGHGMNSMINDCPTEKMMITKVLMGLIGSGDFLVGMYLILLFAYDNRYGSSYCQHQPEWLTGTPCLVLGVISTVGSQVSLFSMTVLSCIIMRGIVSKKMEIPSIVTRKSIFKATFLACTIITVSLAIALTPLVPSFENYFVDAMYYASDNKLLIGFLDKNKLKKIVDKYEDYWNDGSWSKINRRVDDMFRQSYGLLDRRPVHFYGNDGLCLFKYFLRRDDPRRSRDDDYVTTYRREWKESVAVWAMLLVNLFCFFIIAGCYIVITWKTKKSTQESGQGDNPDRLRENRAIQNRIILIIVTDFLCWVPFIFICLMHNLGYIDATNWYASFALIVVPLNSVINPLLYDKILLNFLKRKFGETRGFTADSLRKISVRSLVSKLSSRNLNDVSTSTTENSTPVEINDY